MPENFRPRSSVLCGIMFDAGITRAVLIKTNGDVFIDYKPLPDGFTAKTIACIAYGQIIGPSKELQEFMWARELPPVPVEPPPSGSWLVYLKYTWNPHRLCDSEERADYFIDGNRNLGKIFWNDGETWINLRERMRNGN